MGGRHRILLVEDDQGLGEELHDRMEAMDFECRVAMTRDEARAILAVWPPCAVLQDMQIPYRKGAFPDVLAGESSMGSVRALSNGPYRIVIVVITGYRDDSDFVWRMRDLEADEFCNKLALRTLPDKLRKALKANGREDHARCEWCNAESRPKAAEPGPEEATVGVAGDGAALLYSHERRSVTIERAEVADLIARRAEHDLFLDYTTSAAEGYLAGFRDYARVFHEKHLNVTSASIISELVKEMRFVRADSMKRLKKGGHESAVRLIQQARKEIDVHVVVRGKESRTKWRAIHTVGTKAAMGFVFEPPVGFRYAVMVSG